MKAFTVKVGDKTLDYRLGQKVDLKPFSNLLRQKGYEIETIWHDTRHATGILKKGGEKLFVKLATSEGMSVFSENEFKWNDQFNKLNPRAKSHFWVPQNLDSGYFENLFYFVTDFGEGEKLFEHHPGTEKYLQDNLERTIDFSELIQSLNFSGLDPNEFSKGLSPQEWFYEKAKQWYEGIPKEIVIKHGINDLLEIVREGTNKLGVKPRHGDFTPWHIFKLTNNKLYLFDAEHALSEGVEYYDISYFIQRVFSVLENKSLVEKILEELKKRGYDFGKLRIVLASRAIGGFLDRLFHENPDYKFDDEFKKLTLTI